MAEKNGVSKDVGLLVIRLGVGAMFALFGWQKLKGGPGMWEQVGSAMSFYGIKAFPVFWGFMAMFSEFIGGLMLIMGLFIRPFAALLCFTMITAAIMLIMSGEEMTKYSHPVNMAFVFLGLLFAGGGRYSLGANISALHGKWFR